MKSLSVQSLRILPVLLILALILPPTTARGQGGFNLPHGFIQEMVTAGLTLPTSFALAPDGRIFFTEKAGRVRVFHDDELLSTPFLDITSEVNDAADRGLMGIAVDPDWPSSPYIYLAYAYDPPEVKDRNPTGAASPGSCASAPTRTTWMSRRRAAVLSWWAPTARQNMWATRIRVTPCRSPAWMRVAGLVHDCIPAEGTAHGRLAAVWAGRCALRLHRRRHRQQQGQHRR